MRRPLKVHSQTESALRVAKALKHAGCDSGWSTCRSTSRNRVTREQQEKGPDHPGARVAVKRQEQLGMSSPGEQKTFHKASRRGNSRAATGRGAGRACCGEQHKHGRSTRLHNNKLHQTCRLVNQFEHVCVEECPLTTRHTANRSGDRGRSGESQTTSGTRPGGEERTTVDDRGKPSRARPDERCSSPVAIQTFEAQALATWCSRRRVKVATNTAWRSSRPA